jgi:hypothetical protein
MKSGFPTNTSLHMLTSSTEWEVPTLRLGRGWEIDRLAGMFNVWMDLRFTTSVFHKEGFAQY